MKILLFGNKGQLGWEFQRTLPILGELAVFDYPQIDLSRPDRIPLLRDIIREHRPDLIVNATAYTNVDKAESQRDLAFAVNATSPTMMAEEAAKVGAVLMHFSTDYVFDGNTSRPYTELDSPNPINVYGESKLAGEIGVRSAPCASIVLRTSWVYRLPCLESIQADPVSPDNFVTKVLRWSRQQEKLRLVTDQISNPTWSRMLADVSLTIIAQASLQNDIRGWFHEHGGLYHLAGNGCTSRLEWGKRILEFDPRALEQKTTEVLPALTGDFPSAAQRPLFSALECKRVMEVFGIHLPYWEDSLKLALAGTARIGTV